MSADALQDDQWARQRVLLEEGNRVLRASSALVVGCGGLGAGAIPALVASGVGRIVLLDDDVVELSNLNRQTLFTHADLGALKVERVTERMRELSPESRIEGEVRRLTAQDAELVQDFDVVLDCTDKVASRTAISTSCREAGVPWIWSAIDGWQGVLSVFVPGGPQWEDASAMREELPAPPQILGATPAMLGAWQAAEAVKLLTGQGRPLVGRIAVVDLLAGTVREMPLVARGA